MYNLSPIQQGIQAAHALAELSILEEVKEEYINWVKNDKTMIVLNGGTSTSENSYEIGSMEEIYKVLLTEGIKCAVFHEPDLNYSLSSIALIVPDDCRPFFRSWLNSFKLA